MNKSLLAAMVGLALLSGTGAAHAQLSSPDVFDVPTENSTASIATDTTGILNTDQDIDKHVTSIDNTVNQQQSQVSGMFNTGVTLPMDPGTTKGNLSYTGATLAQDAQAFYAQNDLSQNQSNLSGILASGTDESSTALKNMLITASNIQAMAYDNLQALQTRMQELGDMNSALAAASNITAIEAIKGRISVEILMIQAQQAQATNLAAMASAQQEIDQHNREQAIRIDHQQMANAFSTNSFGLN